MEDPGSLAPAWHTRRITFDPDDFEVDPCDEPLQFYAAAAQRAAERHSLYIDLERYGLFDNDATIVAPSNPVDRFPSVGGAIEPSDTAVMIPSSAVTPLAPLPFVPETVKVDIVNAEALVAGDIVEVAPKLEVQMPRPMLFLEQKADPGIDSFCGCPVVRKPHYNLFVTPWTFVRMVANALQPPGFSCFCEERGESLYVFARWRNRHEHCRIEFYDDTLTGSALRFLELFQDAGGHLEGFSQGLGAVFLSAVVSRYEVRTDRTGTTLVPRVVPVKPSVIDPRVTAASSRLVPYLVSFKEFADRHKQRSVSEIVTAFIRERLTKSVRLYEDVFYFIRMCSLEGDLAFLTPPPTVFPWELGALSSALHEVIAACAHVHHRGYGKLCVMIRSRDDLESLAWFAYNLHVPMSVDNRVQRGSFVLVLRPSPACVRLQAPQSFRHLQNLTGIQVVPDPIWPVPGGIVPFTPDEGDYYLVHFEDLNPIFFNSVSVVITGGLVLVQYQEQVSQTANAHLRSLLTACPYLLARQPAHPGGWSVYMQARLAVSFSSLRMFYAIESHQDASVRELRALASPFRLASSVRLSFGSKSSI